MRISYYPIAVGCIRIMTMYSSRTELPLTPVMQHKDILRKILRILLKSDEWPPQSYDCNPMDYSIWDSCQRRCTRITIDHTEAQLKAKITETRNEITLNEIRRSISSWKKRLRGVCDHDQNGGHIGHLFK